MAETSDREKIRPIVILSGPIGAGKSTIAKEMVASSTDPTVYIEGDTFWSFFAQGAAWKSRHENFRVIMRSMLAASVPYALSGYEVILDFSIPPWFLDTARKIVTTRGIPLDYVVLRPSEAVCAARAGARSEGRIADYGIYHDLYMSFDEAQACIIQDDVSDAKEIAALVRDRLSAGKFRL